MSGMHEIEIGQERAEAARAMEADLLEAAKALASAAGWLDEIDHLEEREKMTGPERRAFLENDAVRSRIKLLTLLLGEITRRTVRPGLPPAQGQARPRNVAAGIDSELEKHHVNGLIERWARTAPMHWIVRMSNGQIASLGGHGQATLFCWGLESAHQAHRKQDHDIDGQQWAYERGRDGTGPQEFWRQRNIRDKYGAAKLAEALGQEP
jgi:hypothetical protein